MKLSAIILAFIAGAYSLEVPPAPPAEKQSQTTDSRPQEWDDWHMLSEHNLETWDANTFFKLHDLQNKGFWTRDDILYVYGLAKDKLVGDGSGMGEHNHGHENLSADDKNRVVNTLISLMDKTGDGTISAEEWGNFVANGQHLPDFGYGQGHHLDFEAEYEDHHWNEFHANDDPDVLVKHKEDIEHELLHHFHEIDEQHDEAPEIRRVTKEYQSPIKVDNLKPKYRA